jgi:hypothetical protein
MKQIYAEQEDVDTGIWSRHHITVWENSGLPSLLPAAGYGRMPLTPQTSPLIRFTNSAGTGTKMNIKNNRLPVPIPSMP